ncbi:rac GTPase-activating protein 1 isoform X2 [Fundulus heteroclitus]|uniref:rac GTPase-activating protein 1 isoform X2 n=1 Tax=Fundulus heteroclitus TaxID=8078 RepID=UPI00165CA78F|nr:rac GTPase-activating protein 1 isoform X2 [Fundulus heteroclitus]
MGDPRPLMEQLLALVQQRINIEESSMAVEREFCEVVKNFEAVRKSWQQAELELKKHKELLVKSDVAKATLEIKLKHARNQLDVEMKKRYKMEADYHYLKRQMQLMCDIVVQDRKSSACLNDEQKSLLATLEHRGGNTTLHRNSKRLSVIDESSFLSHSDISYDRTDDDVDLDTAMIKPLRSRARERRRSSMGPGVGGPFVKRSRSGNVSAELHEKNMVEKEVESTVKASVTTPHRGQIHMVLGITQESPEDPVRSVTQECAISVGGGGDKTSLWSSNNEALVALDVPVKDRDISAIAPQKISAHVFLSKTVIRTETCVPCGKRIRFGKMAVKCRNCRLAAHPECRQKFPNGCSQGRS